VDNPLEYEFSSIDNTRFRRISPDNDYFNLFDFSAKWDPVPTMLTQNHTRTVKGFMGHQHQVGDPPTDLSLHPNSPGYRLILNNVLFPAAKKKEKKT
jgi:hypothetical protein